MFATIIYFYADPITQSPSAYVLSDKGAHIQGIVWKEVGDVLVKVAPETAPIWNV